MNEPNQRIHLLGQAPVAKALLTLGLPTMLGMLINALYHLADTYFVGGLGTYPVGAITVAYPLSQIVVGLGLLFGNGAASYLSRLLGRGDHKQANHAASTALYSSLWWALWSLPCACASFAPCCPCLEQAAWSCPMP